MGIDFPYANTPRRVLHTPMGDVMIYALGKHVDAVIVDDSPLNINMQGAMPIMRDEVTRFLSTAEGQRFMRLGAEAGAVRDVERMERHFREMQEKTDQMLVMAERNVREAQDRLQILQMVASPERCSECEGFHDGACLMEELE